MSIEHLELLRVGLENKKWIILEEMAGDDSSVSAIWKISRPNGDSEFNLVFEGLDDLAVLPIEKSYGCHIQNNEEVGLYFGKVGKSFPSDLNKFMEALSRANT